MCPPDSHRTLESPLEAVLRFAVGSGVWVVPGVIKAAPQRADGASLQAAEYPLQAIRNDLGDCRRCRLADGRTHLVFGVGDPRASIVFVGEGPGADEDRKGEPFVGRAGQLLDLMIRAIGYDRGQVYIANVVKCRPPSNREPREDEKETCLPFLWRQIEAIGPRVICALGGHAAKALLATDAAISGLRGRPAQVRGFTVVPTYHPAFLLRNPVAKRQAWQDLKKLRDLAGAA